MPCWPGKNKKKFVNNTTLSVGNEKARKSVTPSPLDSTVRKFFKECPGEYEKILQEIFSYLPIQDLLQARQVSKMWNFAACHILRLKIEGAIILQRGLSYYTRVMSRSLSIPIGRLYLKIDSIEEPAAQKFFQVVGPSIMFLVLNLEGASLAGFLHQFPHLKNLQQLSLNLFQEEVESEHEYRKRKATTVKIFIDDYDSHSHSTRDQLEHLESFVLSCEPDWKSNEAILLEKILESTPNLKNLNLHKWPFLLKPDLFKKCGFERLKFLNLKTLDDRGFRILGEKQLPNLKTVDFELGQDVESESFQKFLENVSSSLEYIEIKNTGCPTTAFKLTKAMKELNTIRLVSFVGPVYLDSLIAFAPQLEKLQLSHVNPNEIHSNKEQIKTNGKLNYLAINFGSGNHPMKKIFKILKIFVIAFPNLKVLMMKRVSDKILEIICDGWPKLEALRITTSFSLTDSGITGLPTSGLQKIQKIEHRLNCGCCVPVKVKDGKPDCESSRVMPHISLLNNLTDLRIESEKGTNWTLTNLSLHLGLNELGRLNSLRLTSHELGPHWCLKSLADNLPYLQHLTIMDRAISHDRYDEQEIQYLLRKLPNLKLTFTETDVSSTRGSLGQIL